MKSREIPPSEVLEMKKREQPEKVRENPQEHETIHENREASREKARELVEQLKSSDKKPEGNGRFGEFSPDDVGEDGYLHLPAKELRHIAPQLEKLRQRATIATLATGTRISAEYDIKVNNFSTYTSIIRLSDGRKAFAVFAHPGSSVHRTLDGVMKHLAGLRMGKVSRDRWKRAFEEHARIPLFECKDSHMVLMPYLRTSTHTTSSPITTKSKILAR